MGWDGSGNFTRSRNWQNDEAADIDMLSANFDQEDDNFATGINACLTKNGETKPTVDFRPNATRTYALGSTALRWTNAYLSGSVNVQSATAAAATTIAVTDGTSARTITIPDLSGTVLLAGAVNPDQVTFSHASPFIFEGATADDFETTLSITDPTADRTITVPDATGTASLADPVVGSAKSLKITNNATNPNYQLDITADEIVMENASSVSLKLDTWSVTLDITASGANGLDTGAEANSTWYYVWAIYDGTNKKCLFSASATTPTLPTGYTYKALIGAWYNNSGGNLVGGVQLGKEFYYKAGQVVLNAGTATTETSVDIAAYVPPVTVSEVAFLHTYQIGTDAGGGVNAILTLRFITSVDYVINTHKSNNTGGGVSSLTNYVPIPLVATSYYYLLTITQGASVSTTHRLLGFRIK